MNEKVYLLANAIKNKIANYKFESYHKYDAKLCLKNIELIKGKTKPKLLKLSDEYAQDVLGWKGYAPWLYVYSASAETFKEGWIPDNYYGKIVAPRLQGDYGKVSFLKTLSNKLFQSNVFPDIAYYVNGLFYSNEYKFIDKNNLKDYIFKGTDKIIFKKDNSMQGLGIYIFNKSNFDLNKILSLGNGVFQDYINQHPFFEEFMPSSVATLRITTVIDNNGIISMRGCFLRIGREGETHVNAVSDLGITVDLETGELDAKAYDSHWKLHPKHPDTNVLFANKTIPNFNKFVFTATELHKLIPYVRCIGWDMILDNNENIKVMEWNGYDTDIKFHEATQGPCFADLGWENLWLTNSI